MTGADSAPAHAAGAELDANRADDGFADVSVERRTADAMVVAQGRDRRYWEALGTSLARLGRERYMTLECVDTCAARRPARCGLCGHDAGRWTFLVQSPTTQLAVVACGLCVHLLPEAGRRLGRIVHLHFRSMAAIRVLNDRYPGSIAAWWPARAGVPNDVATLATDWYAEEPIEDADLDAHAGEQLSADDLAPEGLGADEIDWEAMDFE